MINRKIFYFLSFFISFILLCIPLSVAIRFNYHISENSYMAFLQISIGICSLTAFYGASKNILYEYLYPKILINLVEKYNYVYQEKHNTKKYFIGFDGYCARCVKKECKLALNKTLFEFHFVSIILNIISVALSIFLIYFGFINVDEYGLWCVFLIFPAVFIFIGTILIYFIHTWVIKFKIDDYIIRQLKKHEIDLCDILNDLERQVDNLEKSSN